MCPRKHEQDQVVPAGTGGEETERGRRRGTPDTSRETWYSYMDHAAYWSTTEPARWCCLSCACLHGLLVACMHAWGSSTSWELVPSAPQALINY